MQTYGLTPVDVTSAIERGSPALPAGAIREGAREMQIALETTPADAAGFLDLPVASRGGNAIYLRDVADVRDGGGYRARGAGDAAADPGRGAASAR